MFNMDFYLLNVSRTFLNSSRKILFCSVVPIDTLRCLLYPQPPQGLTITPTLNNISAISPASYGVLKNTKLACDGKHSHPNFISSSFNISLSAIILSPYFLHSACPSSLINATAPARPILLALNGSLTVSYQFTNSGFATR